ncbi:MAG: hypothetical protein WC340_07235 [Kiritimatiellia bacterium]
MNDDLAGVAEFMWMSAKVLRRIKLNIFFSMIYNVIGLSLSVVGMMTPIMAVIFQEAGCVTVMLSLVKISNRTAHWFPAPDAVLGRKNNV